MSAKTAFFNDFPDSLSPMVVKELRQGLRARAFTGTLLGLHGLLVVATLIASASKQAEAQRWVHDGIATLALCLVLPLRAVNTLADEVKHNTLEMLRMTGLTPMRIVLGKWAAVALMMLLVAVSLLPYTAARYLLGGVELGQEALMLGGRLLTGLVFAAVLVAVSTLRQQWMRSLLVMLPVMFGSFGVTGMIIAATAGRSTSMGFRGMGVGVTSGIVLACSAWAVFAFLSLAATRISPPAQSLSWLKRPVHLMAMFLPLLAWLATGKSAVLVAVIPVLCLMALDAMAEPLNPVPAAYAPFYRRGILGRALLPLLAPGWAAGFWLTVLGVGISCLALLASRSPDSIPYFLLAASTCWMACLIVQVLPTTRKAEDLLPAILGTLAAIWLLVSMLGGIGIIGSKLGGKGAGLLALLPPSALIGANEFSAGAARDAFLRNAMLCASIWPLTLAVLSIRAWRSLAPVRQKAREMAAGR